ncbi:hypothetical protein A3F29_00845 [Candidatus Roizmanbacteria bacterium RIFCSPHIGHO2_12_FULL_33_9]|uniref:O-antigen polymerase n=1 Tax=Candidatus Roizmanbacteria bacterium RIFCSPHIGHO2_12_FULL_33_9 TaxID=1802045 RepID=A0A1F7HG25_9BACT|nr:MAG: hypothetical protein A3F29_00845 [Candidatus Roizmanbacteria bacterium RIFCSPHIGHO2_12_FULL_33_9]
MKRLMRWLKWLDNNILYLFLYVYIFLIPLYFKLPFIDIEYTYVYIRLEDIFIAAFYFLFLIQILRKKVKLQTKFLLPVILFWISIFISFAIGHYILETVPVFQLGFLHTLRRIEYMTIFFVAMSLITSKKMLLRVLTLYVVTLLLVSLYGIGQRLLNFPAVQTANPEYARGHILYLTPEARISSTFGGHFDLSAYMALSIPIAIGYYLYTKRKWVILVFTLGISNLIYTVQRISFFAYGVSTTLFLLLVKRFKLYIYIVLLSAGLILVSGDLTERFAQTFQFRLIFVNTKTGNVDINQTISVKELPAGNLEIPIPAKKKAVKKTEKEQKEIDAIAQKQALAEAQLRGISINSAEFNKLVNQFSSLIDVKRALLCDISCSTRLQIEWPRAVYAFLKNPLFGTGASSLTEATDSDYFRWFGEFGLIGALLFWYILFAIARFNIKNKKILSQDEKELYYGFLFGFFALVLNASYIDVFEASKVAYSFWLIAGSFTGYMLTKVAENKTA